MAYLDCETCLRLWAEYGRATRIPGTNRTPHEILDEIEAHEATAHGEKKRGKADQSEIPE
jgi:hypothetical protein